MKKLRQDDFFDLLKKNQLTPNQYQRLLDFSKHDTWQHIFIVADNQVLFDEEFLVETKDDKCLMTKKGEDLIKKIETLFRKDTAGSKKVDEEFIANVDAYRQLFPAIKLPTGVYARCASKNLEAAFIWFFDNYDYPWDIVMRTTKLYLNQKEMERWQFCKNSQYFIRKDVGNKQTASELANCCENILNGANENEKNFFETKVV